MARKLEVEIVGDASSLHRALNQSTGSTNKFGGVLSKLKYAALGAGAAIGTGVVVGLEKSVHAAIEAQAVHARLEVAFKNAGLNAEKYAKQIDAAESSGRKLGFTDEDVMKSLGSLIVVTKNYGQANREMGIAQDLARFKSVSLEQATKALTMAHAGSLRALKQLGLDIPKVTTAQDALKASTKTHTGQAYQNALAIAKQQDKAATLKNVLDTVTKTVQGQSAAYASTAAGGMEQFRAQLNHIEVEIGNKLLPVITQAIAWIGAHWPEISRTIHQSWVQIHPDLVAFRESVVALTNAIREHWRVTQPILKVEGAIVSSVMGSIAASLRLVTAILKGDWAKSWTNAEHAAVASATAVQTLVNSPARLTAAALNLVVSALKALAHWLEHKFSIALGGVINDVKNLYNWIASVVGSIGALNRALSSIHVPHIHIPGAGILSHIPHASGGMVSSNTLSPYLVGERGPELFVPSGSGTIMPNGSFGGSGTIVFNFPNYVGSRRELMDTIRAETQKLRSRGGSF